MQISGVKEFSMFLLRKIFILFPEGSGRYVKMATHTPSTSRHGVHIQIFCTCASLYITNLKQLNVHKLYTGRSQWPRGLRRISAAAGLLGLWVRIRGHGCLSVVSVVYCQTEVSASGWSLAHRNPIEYSVSECGLNLRQWGGHGPLWLLHSGKIYIGI